MATYIRLTDYKDSDSKEQGFFKSENRYEAKQDDFEKIPGSPIAYWVSDRVKEIFENSNKFISEADPKPGLSTTNNDLFLRYWNEVSLNNIGFNLTKIEAKESNKKWFPHNKGGDFQKWYGNLDFIVNWKNDGQEIKKYTEGAAGGRVVNEDKYFQESISSSAITSSINTYRFYPKGAIFDVNFRSIFFDTKINQFYFLSFLNSKTVNQLLKILSPTMALNKKDLERLPIVFPKQESTKQIIDTLTQECINISKEEWDSRETS